MRIIDKQTGLVLTDDQILFEVNRDHSAEFIPYTIEDLKTMPEDILDWIDTQYFEVQL